MSQQVDKSSMPCNKPRRTPGHPEKSHVVKACYSGKEKIIRFGEQGASTAGKPKAGESERMKMKRKSFKARHAKNIAKGKSSPAYWADKVKWNTGGSVELSNMLADYESADDVRNLVQKFKSGGQAKKNKEPDLTDYLLSAAKTLTSLPEAPKAIYEMGKRAVQATPDVVRSGVRYVQQNSPRQVARDVRGGLNAVARAVRNDPVGTAVDFIPVVGDIKAYGEDVARAAQLRTQGDVAGAQQIERLALPLAIASIAPGVGEARKVGKVARVAEEAADVARAAERVAPRMVKVEGRELPVIYRGSNVDPMETHAKSRAAWFSSSPEVASSYATSPEGSRVTPMALDVDNNLLLEIDAGGKPFYGVDPYTLVSDADEFEEMVRRYDLDPDAMLTTDQLAQIAADSGYKGARIRNIVDPGHGEAFAPGEGVADTYAIFDPSILKPAIPYMGAPKPTIGTKIMKRPASFPVDYGRPKGNLNLRPNIDPVTLKGAEVQDIDSLINQLRGRPGVTKEGLEQVAKQFQPGERVSLADFGKRLPQSEYGTVDLNRLGDVDEHLMIEARDRVSQNPSEVFGRLAEDLGLSYDDRYNLEDIIHDGVRFADEGLIDHLRSELGADSGHQIQQILTDMYKDRFHDVVSDTAERLREFTDDLDGYTYRGYQRLVKDPQKPGYFEVGVTHPERGSRYTHYPDSKNVVSHFRGSFNPEELLSGYTARADQQVVDELHGISAKPNSMVIEEIQSDAQKGVPQTGVLHQPHATAFKAAIQYALEGGADTVYLPTAKTIAIPRGMEPKDFRSIYDDEIVKYGLNPLREIPGVEVNPIDDMYHEITISPEARERILKGAGQKAPGYAEGGLVSSYDEAKVKDLADQIREGIYG